MILDRNQNYVTRENARKFIKKSYIKLSSTYTLQLNMWYEMNTYINTVILPESGL